jgi:hypothetical protein
MRDHPELKHGRDPEYPSPIWANPKHCLHPHEYVRLQAANFPPNNPEAAVWRVDCFVCGTSWDQSNSPDWVLDFLTEKIASGRFEAVGGAGDPDIRSRIEWERQTRNGRMLQDVTGSDNPIEASNQAISTKDLLAKFDR